MQKHHVLFNSICLLSFCLIKISYSAKCDLDHQCPAGLVCRSVSYIPGTKACVYAQAPAYFRAPSPKRPGKCPNTGFVPISASCNSNEDCPLHQKCCPTSYGQATYCTNPMPVNGQPTVTPIIVGDVTLGDRMDFVGAVTLVQSNGYNVLVDTGAPRMTEDLLKNLWLKAGLSADDVDILVTTHGHPDHYASIEAFADIDQVYSRFIVNGRLFRPSPLADKRQYFLNNDRNMEVIQTPGHTYNDISLMVRNVPGMGTVAIVGDLILAKDDGAIVDGFGFDKKLSDENRKKVVCMSDYVVPGHGPIYKIDADQRSKFAC